MRKVQKIAQLPVLIAAFIVFQAHTEYSLYHLHTNTHTHTGTHSCITNTFCYFANQIERQKLLLLCVCGRKKWECVRKLLSWHNLNSFPLSLSFLLAVILSLSLWFLSSLSMCFLLRVNRQINKLSSVAELHEMIE